MGSLHISDRASRLDLCDELEGKDRNLALAIHQMMELGLLLIEKALDNERSVEHQSKV